MRNMTLQLTLTLGQVEVNIQGSSASLKNCVLMHVDDINDVNAMIRVINGNNTYLQITILFIYLRQEAGLRKIEAMRRVAVFRRKVIYKEWEHKLYRANIEYLKYMLDAINKCKVNIEFLNILRNWPKVKAERQKYMQAGAIDRIIEQKIGVFRKQIDRA